MNHRFQPSIFGEYTRAKLACHLKMDHFSRKIVFQRAYFRGYVRFSRRTTGDGSEIPHQLRLAVYPIIYRVLAPCQEGLSPKILRRYTRQEYCTSQKFYVYTKNGNFFNIKESPFPNHHFGYPAVSFQGCRLRDPYINKP